MKPIMDKLVTLAKKGDLPSRRRAIAQIRDKEAVKKLFASKSTLTDERHLR